MSYVKEHNLINYLKRANADIQTEYERIVAKSNEDPGTAGDQGELNWKHILEMWLPSYFPIVTKGRIIDDKGKSSPQVDILVLSPEYPRQLLDCKEYLAAGVVAAFECKVTLRSCHIKEFMHTSTVIKNMNVKKDNTPRGEYEGGIYYGLLAHSHSWKSPLSKPKRNIIKAIKTWDTEYVSHPREMPNILCVADLSTWQATKMIFPTNESLGLTKTTLSTAYVEDYGAEEVYCPIGAMLFNLLNYLAWDYKGIQCLVEYMNKLNIQPAGQGSVRSWEPTVIPTEIQQKERLLKDGVMWDDWGMMLR